MQKRALKGYRYGLLFAWFRRVTSSRRRAIKTVRKMYQQVGLEKRPCTVCGANDFCLLAKTDRYGFDLDKQICLACGLVQTMPSLKPEFLDTFYSKHYRPLYTKRLDVDYDELIVEQTNKGRRFYDYFIKQGLGSELPNMSVIEIGCSSSGILAALAPKVRHVQGCDLDVEGIEYGKKCYGFDLEVSALPSHLPESPRLFILSHVLEHLHNPLETLSKIKELMDKTDYLFIEVPGMNTVGEGNYGHDLWAYFHIAHVSDFTAGTMKVLAAQAGFEVLACNETVTALLKPSAKNSLPWTRSPQDSVENVLRIEATWNKKLSVVI